MRYAESTFGGVDIVINNAGIQHVAPVEQFPVDKWNDILAINLSSVFHTTRLGAAGYAPAQLGAHHQHCLSAWPGGVEREIGRRQARGGRADQNRGPETARSGITCNAICPGWVLTPLVQQQIDKRIAEGSTRSRPAPSCWRKNSPPGVCHPQQLGEMALFLCSDAAARARRRMEHGWRLGGAVSRWRREDQNIARKRFTVRERSKRRRDGDIGLQRRPAAGDS